MSHRSVPVIDIAPFLAGFSEGRARVATQVGRACEEIGFLIVKGHGVPRELVEQMVRVGEETGRLEEMLIKVAETVETDVRGELKRVIGLLEPAVILGMGVLVAFIVVAMLMAIFSINDIPI